MQRSVKHGFSLLELSIVFLVIGFLVAALLSSNALVVSSQSKRIVQEVDNFQSVIQSFFTKYDAMPGDMSDGESYFGTTCSGGVPCEGNGNERMEWSVAKEGPLAWWHMQQAGMMQTTNLSGNYPFDTKAAVNVNVPGSRIAGAGYYINYDAAGLQNFIGFGAEQGTAENNAGIIPPRQAFQVDEKIDDGIAGAGNVRSQSFGTPDCLDSLQYNINEDNALCAQQYRIHAQPMSIME